LKTRLTLEQIKTLLRLANAVRDNAYAPYSQYLVGAAVLTKSGKTISGCNVENASYGLTVCAERNALFAAVAQGFRDFDAIAVVTEDGGSPCGACRQVIWEICGDISVIISDTSGRYEIISSADLLPKAFGGQ